MQVLNPAIQMTWITSNWENCYIKDAEEKIMNVVHLLSSSNSNF
jgi:hypothetical protein